MTNSLHLIEAAVAVFFLYLFVRLVLALIRRLER